MKKLIGTLVAAMLAAAVFADIGIGGFGRGFWAPFAYVDGKATMLHQAGWGFGGPRVGVSLGGSSDNFGFGLNIKGDSGNLNVDDNAFIWAKPWSWMTLKVGQWFDDTLRGGCGFGSYDWIRPRSTAADWSVDSGCVGDDVTFARISETGNYDNPLAGALLALTPVDGLYIAAGFDVGYTSDETKLKKIVDIFKTSQYVVGYTVEGIIAVKAQYIGGATANACAAKAASKGTINAAVDILAVEGHKISVGAFIPLTAGTYIDIAATYQGSIDALGLNAFVIGKIGRSGDPFQLKAGFGIGYDLGDGMAIDADVRANMVFDDTVAGDVSVGAYFSKGFSNGKCGVGVEGVFGINRGAGFAGLKYSKADNKIAIAIPVKFEYWF